MAKVFCLYLDDSGTRNPDHDPPEYQYRDWFGLGGILLKEEDESKARKLHADFCSQWSITYPLRSFGIRNRTGKFSWLERLDVATYNRFIDSITKLALSIPALGHACVVDRPGYDSRYRNKYGRQTWMLCKTAFTVLVERTAKIAKQHGRRLRLHPEDGDPTANARIQFYYDELLAGGMPFAIDTSAKYEPLRAEDFRATLYGLRFKRKSSPLAQIADLYLYPICRGRYEPDYAPYMILRDRQKLINSTLEDDSIEQCGIKYSCFELVDARNTKAGGDPGFSAAPR